MQGQGGSMGRDPRPWRLVATGPASSVEQLLAGVRGDTTELSLDRLIPMPPHLRFRLRHGQPNGRPSDVLLEVARWRRANWGRDHDLRIRRDELTVWETRDGQRTAEFRSARDEPPAVLVPALEERFGNCHFRLERQVAQPVVLRQAS